MIFQPFMEPEGSLLHYVHISAPLDPNLSWIQSTPSTHISRTRILFKGYINVRLNFLREGSLKDFYNI
jgi:hypothetical protein